MGESRLAIEVAGELGGRGWGGVCWGGVGGGGVVEGPMVGGEGEAGGRGGGGDVRKEGGERRGVWEGGGEGLRGV